MQSKCYYYRCHVIKVYDGDTITVNIDLGFNMSLNGFKVRLMGIDTNEMKSQDLEKQKLAKKAQEFLSGQILDKDVFMESYGLDKYGRWLGRIYDAQGLCLNDELVRLGHAVAYDGGTKTL